MTKEQKYKNIIEEIKSKYVRDEYLLNELELLEKDIETSISELPKTRYFTFNTV